MFTFEKSSKITESNTADVSDWIWADPRTPKLPCKARHDVLWLQWKRLNVQFSPPCFPQISLPSKLANQNQWSDIYGEQKRETSLITKLEGKSCDLLHPRYSPVFPREFFHTAHRLWYSLHRQFHQLKSTLSAALCDSINQALSWNKYCSVQFREVLLLLTSSLRILKRWRMKKTEKHQMG